MGSHFYQGSNSNGDSCLEIIIDYPGKSLPRQQDKCDRGCHKQAINGPMQQMI